MIHLILAHYLNLLMHFLNNLTVLIMYYAKLSIDGKTFLTVFSIILFLVLTIICIVKIAKQKNKSENNKEILYLVFPFVLCILIWVGNLF